MNHRGEGTHENMMSVFAGINNVESLYQGCQQINIIKIELFFFVFFLLHCHD